MNKYNLIVLGAGKDHMEDSPTLLKKLHCQKRSLDWLKYSYTEVLDRDSKIQLVLGFRADAFSKFMTEFTVRINPLWEQTGPMFSLRSADIPDSNLCLSYGDVLHHEKFLKAAAKKKSPVTVLVDSSWRGRFSTRESRDISRAELISVSDSKVLSGTAKAKKRNPELVEFAGVIFFQRETLPVLKRYVQEQSSKSTETLLDLINYFCRQEIPVASVDVAGQWAEMNSLQDIAQFMLGTKAESLLRLKPLLSKAKIPDCEIIDRQEWMSAGITTRLKQILESLPDVHLAIRSSARSEDQWLESKAGQFDTVLNCPPQIPELKRNISKVFASYRSSSADDDQVLIQPMIEDISLSGVVMTRVPGTGASYFVINYSTTQFSDDVTSGKESKVVYVHRSSYRACSLPQSWKRIINATEEVIAKVGHDALDIEFAINRRGDLYILQVRPIPLDFQDVITKDRLLKLSTENAIKKFARLQGTKPFVSGNRTFFSNMADWNPAEMIGTTPNALALSLYRHIITDATWAKQRELAGYIPVPHNQLLQDFMGQPYIDIRVDFQSFIPAALEKTLADKLLTFYLAKFEKQPLSHDKVEFDILFTCFTLSSDQELLELKGHGFSDGEIHEIKSALISITRKAIEDFSAYENNLESFDPKLKMILDCKLDTLEKIHYLVQELRKNDALIFAMLARHGFVAVSILESLRSEMSHRMYQSILKSVNSVPMEMRRDAWKARSDPGFCAQFYSKYGHLRPNSYDINSESYRENVSFYLTPFLERAHAVENSESEISFDKDFDHILQKYPVCRDSGELINFITSAIYGREKAKFLMMKKLNMVLEETAKFGESHGIDRESMSHVTIQNLMNLHEDEEGTAKNLKDLVKKGRVNQMVTQQAILPPVILKESDFTLVKIPTAQTNFIGDREAQGVLVHIGTKSKNGLDLTDSIVAIPCADPGYDWIFAHRIAGLITKYGGPNSHMAIRCLELGIPAAIGVGKVKFNNLSDAQWVHLSCKQKILRQKSSDRVEYSASEQPFVSLSEEIL